MRHIIGTDTIRRYGFAGLLRPFGYRCCCSCGWVGKRLWTSREKAQAEAHKHVTTDANLAGLPQ